MDSYGDKMVMVTPSIDDPVSHNGISGRGDKEGFGVRVSKLGQKIWWVGILETKLLELGDLIKVAGPN
jgi:hypothetical protein